MHDEQEAGFNLSLLLRSGVAASRLVIIHASLLQRLGGCGNYGGCMAFLAISLGGQIEFAKRNW